MEIIALQVLHQLVDHARLLRDLRDGKPFSLAGFLQYAAK